MADRNDGYNKFTIINFLYNTVRANTDTVSIFPF
jgi:hypothetical protein